MKTRYRRLLLHFLIELTIYAILVTVYFFLVLRFLGQPLTDLFDADLRVYAGAALLLIVVQSVALEQLTAYLIRLMGLERLE